MSTFPVCRGRDRFRSIVSLASLSLMLMLSACGGGGGNTPEPNQPAPPTPPAIGSFVSDAASVRTLGTTTLSWSASNATSCVAEGAWSGGKSAQGSEVIGPLVDDSHTFVLKCTGAGGSVSSQLTVSVSDPDGVAWAQLDPKVQLLDPSVASLIVEVTDTIITFNGAVPLNAGDLIIANESAYKITAVELLNGQTLATYVPPAIEEMFDKLEITGTFILDADSPGVSRTDVDGVAKASGRGNAPRMSAAGHPIKLGYEVSDSQVKLDGEASLVTTVKADVHFDESKGGFDRSSFEVTTALSASASLKISGGRTASVEKVITSFRLPVPVSIVDAALRLINIHPASIYVPVFAGMNVTAEYEYGATALGSTAARARLEFGGGQPIVSTFTYDTPTFSVPEVSAAPDAAATPFATGSLTTFAYIGARPAFAVLNTVALVGVDVKLGPRTTSTLQFLPQNEPQYCAQVDMGLRASINAYVAVVGHREETEPQTTDLASWPPFELGNCVQSTTLTLSLDPAQVPTVFAPLTVNAKVVLGRPLSGDVQIKLDGASCTATLNTSGAGSCTLTPLTAGKRQIEGTFGSAASAHIPVDIAKAASSAILASEPSTTPPGSLVNFVTTLTGTSGAERGPTGRVTVRDENGADVCEAEVGTSQVGTCTTRLNEAGAFVFTATYAGDDYYEPSTSPLYMHVVGEQLAVRGKGRVGVSYDTRDSAPCQSFGYGAAPHCSQERTGAFDVAVSDNVTRLNVPGNWLISASARGGAVLDGTVTNGTYTGYFEAHMNNPALYGAVSQAGNGWVLDIVVPARSSYVLEIDLSIDKKALSPTQCAAVLIAAFQYLVDGDVEDGQGIGVGAGGNCGSTHNWPTAQEQTFEGTLVPGTYRLFMRSGNPLYPDPEDWAISNTEFGSPMAIYDFGTMDVFGTISLKIQPLP